MPARGMSGTKLAENYTPYRISNNDVSSPPTAVQLTAALGTASGLAEGIAGIVDDAGDGTAVWLCIVKSDAWWYELLTKAV